MGKPVAIVPTWHDFPNIHVASVVLRMYAPTTQLANLIVLCYIKKV